MNTTRLLALASAALFSTFLLTTEAHAAEAGPLEVGAYAMDITPEEFPISSAGSMRARSMTGAHDPLHARCLVITNGSDTVAFAVCDHCMIPRELMDEAKSRIEQTLGIPAKNILISATHTHTGVTVTPVFEAEVDEPYCDFLTDRIVEGIETAWEKRQPAKIGFGSGHNAAQVFNRRWFVTSESQDPFGGPDVVRMNPGSDISQLINPAGPIDPEISFLSVQTADGKPISVLANYSLHYVGGVPAYMLSADYFGEYATRLAAMLGGDGDFVGIMTNGTSGDINNINFRLGTRTAQEPFEQIRLVAGDIAQSTKAVYDQVEYHSALPIDVRETELELGVRKPTAEEVAEAKAYIESQGDKSYSDLKGIYAHETVYLADYPDTVKLKLQAIRIGDIAIATTPCETFAETGIAIKHTSPFEQTFVIELANGYNGYLPTPQQHAWGGYETWRARSSYLAEDAEPQIRAALLGLLEDLAQSK
ncbi:MAG: hypothetical protein CMJ46_08385 [Planctomyces sp.]|nr:hypothetical protein [Planctomyces sp.]